MTSYLIRNQHYLIRNKIDPNFGFGPHKTMVFGIRTVGINTRVIRTSPVCRTATFGTTENDFLGLSYNYVFRGTIPFFRRGDFH